MVPACTARSLLWVVMILESEMRDNLESRQHTPFASKAR